MRYDIYYYTDYDGWSETRKEFCEDGEHVSFEDYESLLEQNKLLLLEWSKMRQERDELYALNKTLKATICDLAQTFSDNVNRG